MAGTQSVQADDVHTPGIPCSLQIVANINPNPILALPPSHPAQSTKNPSPFMGVGQRQELWGSSVTPSAADTKHKES